MPTATTTRLYAVVGDPIAHSLSPVMHTAAIRALGLDACYVALRTTPAAFAELARGVLADGGGLNVTTPFKRQAAELVADATDGVRRTGACNTIWGSRERPRGDNTDIEGIAVAAWELLDGVAPHLVVIHGTGATARSAAIAVTLRWTECEVAVVSRVRDRADRFTAWAAETGVACTPWRAADHRPVDLLVSATPAGPVGTNEEPEADPERRPPKVRAMLDVVYARGETAAVRLFRSLGARAADGRGVLVAQGAAAFRHFFGVEPPVEVMRAAVEDALGP
jgi:shikimate dehydrogenase